MPTQTTEFESMPPTATRSPVSPLTNPPSLALSPHFDLGWDHPSTLRSMNNLGWTLVGLEGFDEGEEMLKNALVRLERVIGKDHPNTCNLRQGLIQHFKQRGKLDEVEMIKKRFSCSFYQLWATLRGFRLRLGGISQTE